MIIKTCEFCGGRRLKREALGVKIAGKDIANPLGSVLSAAMMLDHFGLVEEANAVREAVNWTLTHAFVTKDIDPINNYGTEAVGDLLADYIRKKHETNEGNNASLNASTII